MTNEIASALSYEVLERRRRESELGTPELNQANRRRYAEPAAIAVKGHWIGDRIEDERELAERMKRHG